METPAAYAIGKQRRFNPHRHAIVKDYTQRISPLNDALNRQLNARMLEAVLPYLDTDAQQRALDTIENLRS